MATDEINPYQRNLKVVSGAFIVYWLLGLELKTDPSSGSGNIALMFIQFSMKNPEALIFVSWALLFYSGWRYWVTIEDSFWDKVKDSVRRNLGKDRQRSDSLNNKLKELAIDGASEKQAWIYGLEKPYDWLDLHIAWDSLGDKGPLPPLKCTLSNGKQQQHDRDKSTVGINLSFSMLPANYIKNIFRVLLKEDVTHTTIIPITLFVAAIVAGALTLCGVRPF
ncbi:MAG: hypothetical protein CMF14_05625 [Idiomarina sp.]|nr:hypothetical protein [Idiomarina sp.]|tara:strand:+ start:633 stop:1298 length:666 start_codon:yes stop_codon:yes gene_type:complete